MKTSGLRGCSQQTATFCHCELLSVLWYCINVTMDPLFNPAQWFLTFDSVLLLPSCQPTTEYISETIELSPAGDLTIKLLRWMKKPGFYCYTNICCFIFNLTYFTLIYTEPHVWRYFIKFASASPSLKWFEIIILPNFHS